MPRNGARADTERAAGTGRTEEDRAQEGLLVAGLTARDPEALRRVIDAHGEAIFGIARRIVHDHGLAEEVSQETLLVLWQRPETFQAEKGSLRGFLVRIARNKAIDAVRREEGIRRRAEASAIRAGALEERTFEPAVDIGLDTREAMEALTSEQKQAVFLAYFGGLTYRDVARVLALPEGTVKTRIRDGMSRMRLILA